MTPPATAKTSTTVERLVYEQIAEEDIGHRRKEIGQPKELQPGTGADARAFFVELGHDRFRIGCHNPLLTVF